jgi:hypothetical protein
MYLRTFSSTLSRAFSGMPRRARAPKARRAPPARGAVAAPRSAVAAPCGRRRSSRAPQRFERERHRLVLQAQQLAVGSANSIGRAGRGPRPGSSRRCGAAAPGARPPDPAARRSRPSADAGAPPLATPRTTPWERRVGSVRGTGTSSASESGTVVAIRAGGAGAAFGAESRHGLRNVVLRQRPDGLGPCPTARPPRACPWAPPSRLSAAAGPREATAAGAAGARPAPSERPTALTCAKS